MSITNILAVVPCTNFDRSRQWWERLLESPGQIPMAGEQVAEWQPTTSGGLQVVGGTDAAAPVMITIGVDNITEHARGLALRGIDAGDIQRTGSVSTCVTTDPDGNQVTFAQMHEN